MLKELLKTFLIFCKIGATTFGGGYAILPILQAELVDKRHWLSQEKLADLYAIAQCQPGPIAINTAVLIAGTRFSRPIAIVASLGICFPSLVIILLIALLLNSFAHIPQVQWALNGVKVAVAALVVQIAWKLLRVGVHDVFGAVIFVIASVLLILDLVSAVLIIVAAGAAGVLAFLLKSRKGAAQ